MGYVTWAVFKYCCANRNRIKAIGKHLNPSDAHCEFTGISKFSFSIKRLLMKEIKNLIDKGEQRSYFVTALDQILRFADIRTIDVSNLPSFEIDTSEDLAFARKTYNGFKRKLKSASYDLV